MNTNQLMTWGAIGFAAFAAFTLIKAKRPSGGLATDAAGLMQQKTTQSPWAELSTAISQQQISAMLGGNPFTSSAPSAGFNVPDLINAG